MATHRRTIGNDGSGTPAGARMASGAIRPVDRFWTMESPPRITAAVCAARASNPSDGDHPVRNPGQHEKAPFSAMAMWRMTAVELAERGIHPSCDVPRPRLVARGDVRQRTRQSSSGRTCARRECRRRHRVSEAESQGAAALAERRMQDGKPVRRGNSSGHRHPASLGVCAGVVCGSLAAPHLLMSMPDAAGPRQARKFGVA